MQLATYAIPMYRPLTSRRGLFVQIPPERMTWVKPLKGGGSDTKQNGQRWLVPLPVPRTGGVTGLQLQATIPRMARQSRTLNAVEEPQSLSPQNSPRTADRSGQNQEPFQYALP